MYLLHSTTDENIVILVILVYYNIYTVVTHADIYFILFYKGTPDKCHIFTVTALYFSGHLVTFLFSFFIIYFNLEINEYLGYYMQDGNIIFKVWYCCIYSKVLLLLPIQNSWHCVACFSCATPPCSFECICVDNRWHLHRNMGLTLICT